HIVDSSVSKNKVLTMGSDVGILFGDLDGEVNFVGIQIHI
ncbi:hypothetical protein L914_13961, partial [Phytophthora nicotianae]